MSDKRFNGWEPTETHVYTYDEAGRVAEVTVTREAEWDDQERDKMRGLAMFEAGVCDCGVHTSLAMDKANVFQMSENHCPVCGYLDMQERVRAARDEKFRKSVGEDSPDKPLPSDGRKISLRQLSPAEIAERRAKAAPTT